MTNGKRLFVQGGAMNAASSRRMRDVLEAHLGELGGADACSEAEKSIARRCVITVELERLEASFSTSAADPASVDLYRKLANSLRRQLETMGLQRRSQDMNVVAASLSGER